MLGLNKNRIMQVITQIKGMANPQSYLEQMPQYKQVMDYVNANGGNPKDAFYKLASEMGVNPNDILNSLK